MSVSAECRQYKRHVPDVLGSQVQYALHRLYSCVCFHPSGVPSVVLFCSRMQLAVPWPSTYETDLRLSTLRALFAMNRCFILSASLC